MKMQNQAELTAGADRGHKKHMSGKAYEQVPVLICGSYACRSFARCCHFGRGGGESPQMRKIPPPNTWGRKLNLLNEISSSPKISPPPIHNFGLCQQVRKPPLENPSFPYEYITAMLSRFVVRSELSVT